MTGTGQHDQPGTAPGGAGPLEAVAEGRTS